MQTIREYTIELQVYHDEVIGRLQYEGGESGLYSLGELQNIIGLWQSGGLMGSFGIGTVLADNARATLKRKGV